MGNEDKKKKKKSGESKPVKKTSPAKHKKSRSDEKCKNTQKGKKSAIAPRKSSNEKVTTPKLAVTKKSTKSATKKSPDKGKSLMQVANNIISQVKELFSHKEKKGAVLHSPKTSKSKGRTRSADGKSKHKSGGGIFFEIDITKRTAKKRQAAKKFPPLPKMAPTGRLTRKVISKGHSKSNRLKGKKSISKSPCWVRPTAKKSTLSLGKKSSSHLKKGSSIKQAKTPVKVATATKVKSADKPKSKK